jgi:hypothetical protein
VIGSSVARDVEALYLINKDGSLVLRASNKFNSGNFLTLTNEDEYVSALGLVYRQEFDNMGEFLRMLISRNRKEERKKKESSKSSPQQAVKPKEPETEEK